MKKESDISACISGALETYFEDLDGEKPAAVYDMVLKSVERPMLEAVMEHAGGNQTLAAEILGINRNTLRKKLVEHRLVCTGDRRRFFPASPAPDPRLLYCPS